MKTVKTILLTLLAVTLAAAVALAVVALGGWVDVAATSPSSPWVDRFLHATRENAVARATRAIEVPPLDGAERVERGLAAYHRLCAGCHGAPGVEPADAARGLNPLAPDLAGSPENDPARLFWITKNGIRMTGMPAFGPTHADEEIWDLVAAVTALGATTAEAYERAVGEEKPAAAGAPTAGGSALDEGPGDV